MKRKLPVHKENGRLIPVLDRDLTDFPGEVWKDIPGYDDIYQLSSHGRLKSLERYIYDKNGVAYPRPDRILTISIHIKPVSWKNHFGKKELYVLEMHLVKDRIKQSCVVGRYVYNLFVAAFDLNDQGFVIKNKDGNPFNCHYSNLELRPCGEMIREGLQNKTRRSSFDDRIQPVHQYDLNGKFIQSYPSIKEAAKTIGVIESQISNAAGTSGRICKMHHWEKGKAKKKLNVSKFKSWQKRNLSGSTPKKIEQIDKRGKVIASYDSMTAATEALGLKSVSAISYACRGEKRMCMGYYWRVIN